MNLFGFDSDLLVVYLFLMMGWGLFMGMLLGLLRWIFFGWVERKQT